jgi:hypothetical protein
LRDRVREGYGPQTLLEEFLCADVSYAHRQVTRYQRFREGALLAAIKQRFFAAILPANPKLTDKEAAKLWRKHQPTEAGIKMLTRSGSSMDEIAAEAFLGGLQAYGTMDALLAHQRAVRNEASRELEIVKAERKRRSQLIEAPFRPAPKDDDS